MKCEKPLDHCLYFFDCENQVKYIGERFKENRMVSKRQKISGVGTQNFQTKTIVKMGKMTMESVATQGLVSPMCQKLWHQSDSLGWEIPCGRRNERAGDKMAGFLTLNTDILEKTINF